MKALQRLAPVIGMGLAFAGAAADVTAQSYPVKPIRVIRPHPAGASGDIQARGIAQVLAQNYGQAFVIENRVGGDGIIGAEACAKAAPDGYTICSTDSAVVTSNPVVRSTLPYEPLRDFAPIIHLGFGNSYLLVHPSLPVRTVKELLDLARAKPGALSWASAGPSSAAHFYIEWMRNSLGIAFLNVPYKTNTQALQAVTANEVNVATYQIGLAKPSVEAGKVRALATAGTERSPYAPDVPSYREAGIDISIAPWWGWFMPAGTPAAIIHRLNTDIAKLYQDTGFREKYAVALAFEMVGPALKSPEEFTSFLKADRETYARVAKIAGVKPQ
jgi:tripartite-type tricarboxylate transporter receptor subunit TctC